MFATDVHVAKEEIACGCGCAIVCWLGLWPYTCCYTRSKSPRSLVGAVRDCCIRYGHRSLSLKFLREEIATRFSECSDVYIYGDPAGDFRAQTDESTPFHILRGAGLKAFPAPSNSVDLRLESVSSQLTKMVEGKPAFLIDRRCQQLIKGFEGGYQYKRMEVSGERYADKPDKNMYSHIHDALQYMMLGAGEGQSHYEQSKTCATCRCRSKL